MAIIPLEAQGAMSGGISIEMKRRSPLNVDSCGFSMALSGKETHPSDLAFSRRNHGKM